MIQAIDEYRNARELLIKSFRKLNYRIAKEMKHLGRWRYKYFVRKVAVMKELRKMDKVLRKMIEAR